MDAYTEFKVLLDHPAQFPGLGFDAYASALAEITTYSRAEFAVGIFGSWGSGKTTLMRAIKEDLDADEAIVTVWFTAWRYEKDPHLIVPLLDVLREALAARAGGADGWAGTAAAAVARAGRLFLAGLKISAGVPWLQAEFEPGKVIAAIEGAGDDARPLSFYHEGFTMLRDAIRELSADGSRRVVIFVDDLDRCLPSNALDVLESMKLFFDVEGCVFVVGLDQAIVEQAVAAKYGTDASTGSQDLVRAEYVKKIFQVPFALPRLSTRQLQDYLTVIADSADLGAAQRQDFDLNVRRHLRFLPAGDSVNPREVKRLINAYTLQLKMLSARLGPLLDANVVLALQCMSFRPDWRDLYDQLAADPGLFQSAMREAIQEEPPAGSVWLSGVKVALPLGLPEYLATEAGPVLHVQDLQLYVSAAESTQSTDPSVLEARTTASRLRRSADELASGDLAPAEAARRIPGDIQRLASLILSRSPRAAGRQLQTAISQLETIAEEIKRADSSAPGDFGKEWAARAAPLFDAVDTGLRELQRSVNVGTY
jgi:hypothetical protein